MASDSDGDEDFVTYGTPLEPLEEGGVNFMISVICLRTFKKISQVFNAKRYELRRSQRYFTEFS